MEPGGRPGAEAIAERGWFAAHRYLILRRISQLSILVLFLLGPLAGIWIVKGNLASSLTLDVLPLTDPLVLLQVFVSGHLPEGMRYEHGGEGLIREEGASSPFSDNPLDTLNGKGGL